MAKAVARITSKSQLVLPKAVRKQLGVGPGDSVVFNLGPDGVRIEKAILAPCSARSKNLSD